MSFLTLKNFAIIWTMVLGVSPLFTLFIEPKMLSSLASVLTILGGFLIINYKTAGLVIYLAGIVFQILNFFDLKEYLFAISYIFFVTYYLITIILWLLHSEINQVKRKDLSNYLYLFLGFLVIFGLSFAILPVFVGFFERKDMSLEIKVLQFMITTSLLVHGILLSLRFHQSWIFYGLQKILLVIYLLPSSNLLFLLINTALELGLVINYWIRMNPDEEKPKPKSITIHSNKITLQFNPMFQQVAVQEEPDSQV